MIKESISQNMRAALWYAPGIALTVQSIPTPKIEDEEDVLIKVRAAIFGSALVRAATVGHPKIVPPDVLGTLVAGDVVAVGAKVNIPIGTPVTVDPHPPCHSCPNCLNNAESLCLTKKKVEPGGLSEYVRIRRPLSAYIREIPSGLSYASAAYTEIVACVAEATLVSEISFGDTVVVVGCGPIALLQIQLARLRGATQVICLSNHPERETAIIRAGAVMLDVKRGDIEKRVKELLNGQSADVVIEAVGRSETYSLSLNLVRPGGSVVGFGGCLLGSSFTIDPNYIHYQGIRLIGCYHYRPGMFNRALKLLATKKVALEEIITHRLPLSEVSDAPKIAGSADCIALVIEPDNVSM